MLNIETIIYNECRNDGKTLYLYESEEQGGWVAFGESAFRLAAHFPSLAATAVFSEALQMPMVSGIDLRMLQSDPAFQYARDEPSSGCRIWKTSGEPDRRSYREWARELRIEN